jgi:hypothetical protein
VEIEGYLSKQTPTFANRGNDHGIYIHLQAPRPEIHPELDLLVARVSCRKSLERTFTVDVLNGSSWPILVFTFFT